MTLKIEYEYERCPECDTIIRTIRERVYTCDMCAKEISEGEVLQITRFNVDDTTPDIHLCSGRCWLRYLFSLDFSDISFIDMIIESDKYDIWRDAKQIIEKGLL